MREQDREQDLKKLGLGLQLWFNITDIVDTFLSCSKPRRAAATQFIADLYLYHQQIQ